MNLTGLLPIPAWRGFPGISTATGNISVTVVLALFTFVITQIAGMRAQGVVGYWVHLVPSGVPVALWPLMFVIELFACSPKPFALTVRLFANMVAGHIVIFFLIALTLFISVRRAGERGLRARHLHAGAVRRAGAGVRVHDAFRAVHRHDATRALGAGSRRSRLRGLGFWRLGPYPATTCHSRRRALGIHAVGRLNHEPVLARYFAAGIGAGLAVLGAGFGIGRLAAAAMEGTARQPSAGGDIRTSMIIAAALIEGVTLFAEVVCIILAVKV